MLKLCKIHACPNGTLGLHLSRAPWDPYPWVSGVQQDSNAYHGGVRSGDTVLELNGSDVLGQKISELATKIQQHWERGGTYVTVLIWRNKTENSAINQQSLQKFAKCLQNIAQLLECPVCLEVVKPPGWQCCNGHVLCNSCRGRTVKCPICRVTLGPRGRCLLADKLFTLLAESFPCDGVRGGKPSADCPKDYNDCQETPSLISARIDSPPVSASSSPSLDKFHQRTHTGNTISEHLKKQEDVSDQLAANGNPSDDNIVVLKLNSNSEKKYDSVEYNPCHHHHHHHRRVYHSHSQSHSQSHSPSHTQKHHTRRRSPTVVAQQPRRTFHCPTGKSLCSILLHNATANGASNNSRSDPDAKTLASTWTQDVSRKPMTPMAKGEEKIETFGRFITEWEVLSHLTQVHQMSVHQHYTTFGQAVRLQVMPAKAISCITIQSRRTWNQNKENLKNNASESVEKVQGHTLERNKNSKTSCTPKNVHRPGTELFFVACIPLQQTGDESQEADELRNEMNDMNADTQVDTPPPSRQPEFDDCCSVDADNAGSGAGASADVAASPRGPSIGAIKTATKSKSTDERTLGRGTGHLIQDASPESRVNVECSPPAGFRMNSPEDVAACSWCASSPSSSSASSSCSSSISSSTLFTSTTAPPSPSTSSLASFSLSDSSYRCCSNTMTQQHAIFIWYLGSECDVENFQTVIECKRSGLKWTGCVYPLTESWSSIRRGQQQPHALSHPQPSQQEWPKQRFLVLNSMPDGGDNFFDIVIKIK